MLVNIHTGRKSQYRDSLYIRNISTGVYMFSSYTHYKLPFIFGYEEDTSNVKLEARKICISTYGVCDTPEQATEYLKEVYNNDGKFIVVLTPVRRNEQPSKGGWRWHKWGMYIGNKNKTSEYLYDEKTIEMVYVFSLIKIKE